MGFIKGRALHYVFKIPDRKETIRFYREVLGMKVLRHEEFSEGCEATCNGPYSGRWSKTMVGYGPEDNHFAIELTYNYGIHQYEKGNDFIGITIKSKEALERAKKENWPVKAGNVMEAPGGYLFNIIAEPQPTDRDPVEKVTVASSNLEKSIKYWNGVLGLEIFNQTKDTVLVGFNKNEAKLELKDIGKAINRAKAYGRIAFSCPKDQQEQIDKVIRENNCTIVTPLISLDTPGKATVTVIILADPDGLEICFVDDENYRLLSQPDPDSERVLNTQMRKDKS
ncbi:hypothetical protein NQ315_010809 [Exocentrus adspersus]|uniref:VOC domain-containing protein n=1 Tax=Exocentrus adspersus TaxID=1586481 RepID=A0AAV8V9G3_9CUCU|nr:hypothetical protein NQ315_010809 [Exocentrus adspersus]